MDLLLAKGVLPRGLLTDVVQFSWFLICQAQPCLSIEFLTIATGSRLSSFVQTFCLLIMHLGKLWFNVPQFLHLFLKDNKMLYHFVEWKWTWLQISLELRVLFSSNGGHCCALFMHSATACHLIISYSTMPWMCRSHSWDFVDTLPSLFEVTEPPV